MSTEPLTNDEIHALNLRLAREVMGYREIYLSELRRNKDDGPFPFILQDDGGVKLYQANRPSFVIDWSPCTNANHAMQVVEKMRERAYVFEATNADKLWKVSFDSYESPKYFYFITDASLPLAICSAAVIGLDAKGRTG